MEMAVAAAGATAKAAREVAVMAVAEEKWAGAKVAMVEVAVNLALRRDGGGDGGRGRDGGGGDGSGGGDAGGSDGEGSEGGGGWRWWRRSGRGRRCWWCIGGEGSGEKGGEGGGS